MQRFTVLILFALIPACQPAYINGTPNERSPYFEVPVDSKLILNRTITVEAGQKSAYFQRGQQLKWFNVDKYAAYCALTLDRELKTEQTIEPGELEVYKVFNQHLFQIAKARSPSAPTGDFRPQTVQMRDGGRDTYQVLAVIMELRSAVKSDVRRLICANWVVPQGMQSVTVNGIRQSLGDFASLKLAPTTDKR